MISIIIPIYNQADKIGECLKSIFTQIYKDFEIIVVDDGSTDNLVTAIRPWQSRIKLLRQKNKGAPSARNLGFKNSSGQYVIFCDADVVMRPDMLEKMMGALTKNPEAGFAYSSFRFGFKKFKLWPYNLEKLKKKPYIHSTSLIKRKCFPGWDEFIKRFQDWDLFLTIAEKNCPGVWINEVLFKVSSGGIMSHWLPKWFYYIPWLKKVKEYKEAEKLIKIKHKLT